MRRAKAVGRWMWARALYITAAILLIIGIASLTVAINANTKAAEASTKAAEANERVAEEANQRAVAAEAQAEHQRLTFCGVFEPIVEAGKIPPAQPRTQFGESIVRGSQKVVSPEGLACTPDPLDGR